MSLTLLQIASKSRLDETQVARLKVLEDWGWPPEEKSLEQLVNESDPGVREAWTQFLEADRVAEKEEIARLQDRFEDVFLVVPNKGRKLRPFFF